MANKKHDLYKECVYKKRRKYRITHVNNDYLYSYKKSIYDTNYDLLNRNGEIILSLRKAACFRVLANPHGKYYLNGKRDYTLNIFIPFSEIGLSEEHQKRYIKRLRRIGKFKYKILKNYRLEGSISDYNSEVRLRKRENVYMFTLHYKDFKSMAHLKLLVYTLRFMYEFKTFLGIEKYFEYEDKNPKCPFITMLNLFVRIYATGHFYNISNYISSDKTFMNNFHKIMTRPYDNNELSSLYGLHNLPRLEINRMDNWSGSYYLSIFSPISSMLSYDVMNIPYSELKNEILSRCLKRIEAEKNNEVRSIKLIKNSNVKDFINR